MLDRIAKAQQLIGAACEKLGRPLTIMEVCGTHTVSIFRHGIRSTLPEGLKLLSGPGCPVCVTDQGYIDAMLELAGRDDCLIATYGDMIRVPGSAGSLETRVSEGIGRNCEPPSGASLMAEPISSSTSDRAKPSSVSAFSSASNTLARAIKATEDGLIFSGGRP